MNKEKLIYLLKVSLPASVLWFFFETVENATLFYNFFPRGGFFKMAFDGVVLKFLLLPGLMLVLGTFAIYFLFVFAAAWLSLSVAGRLFPRKEQGSVLTFFHAVNVYLAMYLIASLNAFLMPQSLARHPFLYSLVFPQRAVTVEMPAPAFFYWLHDGAFVYWHLLLFAFVVGSVRPVSRFLKTRPRLFISLMGIVCLIISAGVGARFLANAKNKETLRQQGHVIFIGLDSFQYNQMSPQWGSFDVPAPDVLRFVQEGTSFTNAWTSFARTYPSYISLLTGRYPAHTGIRDNLVEDLNERPGNIYLGDLLKANGYYRFYATDDVRFSNIRTRHGFDETFTPEKNVAGFLLTSFYDYALGNLLMYHDALPGLFQPVINNRAATAYHPQVFMRHLIARLKRLPKDKKQFMVIHLCMNHQPYTAVYPYARNPELRDISARCMRSVNDQFVMLRDYLKTSGLADGAMIVLYSDHGSGWDRKYLRLSHGSNFDCIEAYRSILSIHAPGFPAGHEVAARVRMIDIYPTVLEWLELNPVSGIDGKSLLALAGGQNESEPRAVFAETGYTMDFRYNGDPFSEGQQIRNEVKRFKVDAGTGHIFINDGDYQDVIARKWYMLIDGNYRFVWQPWTRTETLSDLDGEPVSDPEVARAMQEKLERYRRQ